MNLDNFLNFFLKSVTEETGEQHWKMIRSAAVL